MGRTVPSAITAKQGSGALFFIWLVELHLSSGTIYLSSGPQVTFGGHVYVANKVKSIGSLTAQYIDYKRRDFGGATIVLDNLADDGGEVFPFTAIEGSVNMEDARVFVHCFDVDANDGVDAIWSGYAKSREYDATDKTVSITCSFLWDSPGIVIPSSTLQQEGFATLDTGQVKDSVIDETGLPLVYGAGGFKVRPTIYASRVEGSNFYVNGVISGCGTTPFGSTDIVGMTLFDNTPATSVNFTHRGQASDPLPTDITAYPDGLSHNYVAYFNAVFPITDANKDKLDDIQPDDIKLNLANGRPLIDTALPSQNGVLIIKDVLQDPRFGLGFSDFDDLTASANTAGLLWQCRLEQHDQVPVGDFLQQCLGQIQGYLTFNNRLLQIGIKTGSETSVATFGRSSGPASTTITLNGGAGLSVTLDTVTGVYSYTCGGVLTASGTMDSVTTGSDGGSAIDMKGGRTVWMEWHWSTHSGSAYIDHSGTQSCQITDNALPGVTVARMICDDEVKVSFESADDLINQANITYRLSNRHQRQLIAYDENSQSRAGGTIRKANKQDFDFNLLFDHDQVAIAGSMILREEQNANMMIEFRSPLPESLSPAPGSLITVINPNIPNNAVNRVFRVIAQTFSTGDIPDVTFVARIYEPSVYDYSTTGIGIDLIRSGSDVSSQGRPPDVTPVSLVLVDKVTNDTQGVMGNFRAAWTYPTVDLAGDAAAGVFREYPIRAVQLYCRFEDEGVNEWKLVKEVQYPASQGDFYFQFIKSKSIQVAFVALGLNRSHGALGYVPDPTKISALTANLSSTAALALIGDSTPFTAGDYTRTEFEIDKLSSKSTGQLNFVTSSGNRQPQFDTVAIAHPTKTQIAVAKQNYPTLTLALTAPRFTYPAVSAINVRQRPDGVKVKITDVSAENLEDYLTYWSIVGDPGSGSATPGFYTTNPLSPPGGVNLISGKAIHFTIPQEDIGPAGTIVYVRVAARNGKHNYSSALSPLASSAVGDDAVPTANQPRVVIKKRGLRVVEPMPTTNMKTFALSGKVEIVIQAKDSGGSSLGYLTDSTGTDLTSQAGEYRFDLKLANSELFPINKESTLALWPTASTLEASVYLTNAVGTSAKSTVRVVTVSTWEVGDMPTDTAVPSGLSAPTFARVKKNGFHLRFPLPTANRNSHSHNLVVIASASAPANGVKVLTASDLSTGTILSSSDDSAGRIDSGRKKTTVEIDKIALEAVFGVGATIFVYFYAVNDVGVSGVSPAISYNLATGEAAAVGDDVAAPSGLATPTIKKLKKAGLKLDLTAPAVDNLRLHFASVYLANGAHGSASTWLSAADLTSSTNTESVGAIQAHPSGGVLIPADRATLEAVFGAGATISVYATWTNEKGTSGFSSAATYNLATGEISSVSADSAVPSGLSAPAVEQADGHIFVSCVKPTTAINTLDEFQVVMSTQNTAPAGTPTVGSEGVVKIKQGQSVSFKAKRPQDVDLYFYYRAHNLVGYSAWSGGTTLTVAGVTRPLLDFVGSGTPSGDEGLAYTANSGTGHGTTTFVLDSGASSVDGFYVGMALNIPSAGTSSPDGDTWRTITAYVGSARTVTVDTAFSSAPSGSKLFAVHRIGIAGDRATRSGTGHTNITFVLDASASAVNDFYKAFTLYVPSVPNGPKRARKVLSYNGSTKTLTLENAFGSTPSGQLGYLLVNGSIGYATPLDAANTTGLVSPVPFRWYLDGATDQLVFQILPPTSEGISLEHFQVRCRRENSTAPVKFDSGAVPIVSGLGTQTGAPFGITYAGSVRFHNLYRGGGSDGWGAESFHVDLPRSQSDSGSPGTPNNDPEQFGGALLIDYEGPNSYTNKILTY